MFRFRSSTMWILTAAAVGFAASPAAAQSGGGNAGTNVIQRNNHVGFERPEAWGLKYFASSSLLSGLPAPAPAEGYHFGSISVGFEAGWLPKLDTGQQQIGFNGRAPEDLNKAPILARPVFRVGLPHKFTAVVAPTPPMLMFGVHAHLVAFGLERPIIQRGHWTLGWRGYGQLGSVKGAFTCPNSVLGDAPGSPGNPARCLGESADRALLRYAGSEFQFSYRVPRNPKFIPHVAVAGNFIDGVFETDAPVTAGRDLTRLWTRGGTFSTTGGITYMASKRTAVTVDAFYSPLWVKRSPTAPTTNDGLFNVRAGVSYNLR